MFWVMIDNRLLHHPDLAVDGLIVSNPVLHEEVNSQGWFRCLVPPNNPEWPKIEPRTSYIRVYSERGLQWRGRVSTVERGWNNCKEIYCEGELSFLQDSIIRPVVMSANPSAMLANLLANHNSQVDAERRFSVGIVTVSGNIKLEQSSPQTTWTALSRMRYDLGGYIRTRTVSGTVYIDWLEDFVDNGDPIMSRQTVDFGQNLLDISTFVDSTKVVTCLVPYGKYLDSDDPGHEDQPESGYWDGNQLTIKTVNGGKDYIKHTQGVALFGEVWGTKSWPDISTASALKTEATKYLNGLFRDALTIEATAIDLSALDVETDQIKVGTYTRVRSALHGIDEILLCRAKETPLTELQKSKIVLGVGESSLSEITGKELTK